MAGIKTTGRRLYVEMASEAVVRRLIPVYVQTFGRPHPHQELLAELSPALEKTINTTLERLDQPFQAFFRALKHDERAFSFADHNLPGERQATTVGQVRAAAEASRSQAGSLLVYHDLLELGGRYFFVDRKQVNGLVASSDYAGKKVEITGLDLVFFIKPEEKALELRRIMDRERYLHDLARYGEVCTRLIEKHGHRFRKPAVFQPVEYSSKYPLLAALAGSVLLPIVQPRFQGETLLPAMLLAGGGFFLAAAILGKVFCAARNYLGRLAADRQFRQTAEHNQKVIDHLGKDLAQVKAELG